MARLQVTGEVDKCVRRSCQIFSGYDIPKYIKIGQFLKGYSKNKKVDIFETLCTCICFLALKFVTFPHPSSTSTGKQLYGRWDFISRGLLNFAISFKPGYSYSMYGNLCSMFSPSFSARSPFTISQTICWSHVVPECSIITISYAVEDIDWTGVARFLLTNYRRFLATCDHQLNDVKILWKAVWTSLHVQQCLNSIDETPVKCPKMHSLSDSAQWKWQIGVSTADSIKFHRVSSMFHGCSVVHWCFTNHQWNLGISNNRETKRVLVTLMICQSP